MSEGGHLADKDDFRKQAPFERRDHGRRPHRFIRVFDRRSLRRFRVQDAHLESESELVPMDHDQRIVLHAIFGHPANSNRRGGRHHVPTGLGAEMTTRRGAESVWRSTDMRAAFHLTNHSLLNGEVLQICKF